MKRTTKISIVAVLLETMLTFTTYYSVTRWIPDEALPLYALAAREIGRLLSTLLPPVPLSVYLGAIFLLALSPIFSIVYRFSKMQIEANPAVFQEVIEEKREAPGVKLTPSATLTGRTGVIAGRLVESDWFRKMVFRAIPQHPPLYYAQLVETLSFIGIGLIVLGLALLVVKPPFLSQVIPLISLCLAAAGAFFPISPILYLYVLTSNRKSDVEESGPLFGLYLYMGISAGASLTKLFQAVVERPKSWWNGNVKDARFFLNARLARSESDSLRLLSESHPSSTFSKLFEDLASEIELGGNLSELLVLHLESIIESFRSSLQKRIDLVDMLLSGVLTLYSVLPASLLSMGIVSTVMGGGGIDILGLSQMLVVIAPAMAFLGLATRPPDSFEYKIGFSVIAASLVPLVAGFILFPLVQSRVSLPLYIYLVAISSGLPSSIWLTAKERRYMSVLDGAARFTHELQDSVRAGRTIYMSIKQLSTSRNFGYFTRYLRDLNRLVEIRGVSEAFDAIEPSIQEPVVKRLFSILRVVSSLGVARPESFKMMSRFFRDLRDTIRKYKSEMLLPRIIGFLSTFLLIFVLQNMISAMSGLTVYSTVQEGFKSVPTIINYLKNLLPFYVLAIGFVTGATTQNRITGAVREAVLHAVAGLVLSIYFGVL